MVHKFAVSPLAPHGPGALSGITAGGCTTGPRVRSLRRALICTDAPPLRSWPCPMRRALVMRRVPARSVLTDACLGGSPREAVPMSSVTRMPRPSRGEHRLRRRALLAAALLTAAAGGGCVQTTAVGAAGVDRSQLMLVSQEAVHAEAAAAYAEAIDQARSHGALLEEGPLWHQVRRVSARLIAQVGCLREDAREWAWQVQVVRSSELNAWCMPGGRIVVYSGLISGLHLSDDELAVVLGHEIAHALREHTREQASQALLQQGALQLTSMLGFGGLSLLGSVVGRYGITLPFSREHESEADELGLELMARAGYDPRSGPRVWEKMQAAGSGRVPELLSTHPGAESRARDLQALGERLLGQMGAGGMPCPAGAAI